MGRDAEALVIPKSPTQICSHPHSARLDYALQQNVHSVRVP